MDRRSGRWSEQVNVSMDENTALALRLIATRDGVSVPDLLRPLVEDLVRERLKDRYLAAAVDALKSSRNAKKATQVVRQLQPHRP